jgi:hypothetical protein
MTKDVDMFYIKSGYESIMNSLQLSKLSINNLCIKSCYFEYKGIDIKI